MEVLAKTTAFGVGYKYKKLGTRSLPGVLPGRSYRVTGYSKLTGKVTILTG